MYAAPIKNMSVPIASGPISEDSVQRVHGYGMLSYRCHDANNCTRRFLYLCMYVIKTCLFL